MGPAATIFLAGKTDDARARDRDVRSLLKQYLQAGEDDSLLMDELGLCQGDVRIDVAVVNGELSGYEIKSPSDTLARWPKQRRIYSRVVDRAWLVAPLKTLERAEMPRWWGQIGVFDSDDKLALRVVRPSQPNPNPDALSIARLLWRDEAIELLRSAGTARGVLSKSRGVIWERISETVALDDLRAAVRVALKKRPARVAALAR
ncbi:MAG: sce7726 family protein [Vicinamibacterales bacterium]